MKAWTEMKTWERRHQCKLNGDEHLDMRLVFGCHMHLVQNEGSQ